MNWEYVPFKSEYAEIEQGDIIVRIPRRLLKNNVKTLDLVSVEIIVKI
jgi:hypothetical protein